MAQLTAQWQKIGDAQPLQRSSQVVSIVNGHAYVYGGELEPRKPRDNDIQTFAMNEKGVAIAPIDESGGVWEYTPSTSEWALLTPRDSSAESIPEARSFHCLTSDGRDMLYLHAGCPERGRLSDLWAFRVSDRAWTKLSSAPEPGRGGTSVAFAGTLLYRMNGFDGKNELGGALDIYDPQANSWTSHTYPADGQSGPGPRSVSALLPIQIRGRSFLVTLFGERDPSTLGHEGAGKMLDDVWAFDVASKQWYNIEARGDESLSRSADRPVARGWYAADSLGNRALVQGGMGETNIRIGDAWLLAFDWTKV